MKKGQLYIVSTPIGNLEDITLRALTTLRTVEWIAAEDTRYSQRLLKHYGISTACISLHEFNETARIKQLLPKLSEGNNIALISDAGTPLISDPGYRLVYAAKLAGITVVPIPGPSALLSALVASGLPAEQFLFAGFVPAKGERRRRELNRLTTLPNTVIIYESRHRIRDLLEQLLELCDQDRFVCLARELTKTFEIVQTLPISSLVEWFLANPEQEQGEFVIILSPYKPSQSITQQDEETQKVLSVLLEECPLSQAVAITVKITGQRRKLVYEMALALKQST